MGSTNQSPQYQIAEEKFLGARSNEEKLIYLEEMIRECPKHKSSEKMLAQLKNRRKRLKQELEKSKKKRGSGKSGIRKEDLQAVLVGLTNSGKSSILKSITNAQPRIASYGFTTTEPEIGTLNHANCNIQIIDLPPIASENFDKGIVNNANSLLIVVEKIHEIQTVLEQIKQNKHAKRIIIFNKIDLYNEEIKRKIKETLRSKKYNFCMVSTATNEGLEDLKEKIFKSFDIIRIYTKHPKKKGKLDNVPVILPPNSTLQDVAEKILHDYSKKVRYAKITGPSCKFPNQKVGLKHIVKDKDIVEFVTE